MDCDFDTIKVMARPQGPVCHTGSNTCFNNDVVSDVAFLDELTALIAKRHRAMPKDSYTASLFKDGSARIAQKVGEEGVELAIARMKNNTKEIKNEAADLLFHLMILLEDAGLKIGDVLTVLKNRKSKPKL